ncbi:MAG: cyclic nucleotide-binding domain-containing protein [Rhodoferax sp.]|nr:cyclic nucleotide-binding domain-containing protein [Rhodoferax sp.]
MRTRPLTESATLAAKAVQFLCQNPSSFAMDTADAECVVSYLRWVSYPAGAPVYREGDDSRTSYMLLVLEGDVSVDTGASGRADRVAISVLGAGALIGEMALLDGAARSANCTALATVQAAGLSHTALEHMAKEHPEVACKLLVYMARNTADRLRALSEQLHIYDQLNATLRQEAEQLRAKPGR